VVLAGLTLFNAVIGLRQESKAEESVKALAQMMKTVARVRRDGQAFEIDAEELVVGDVVLVEAGNRVPADGRICVAATLEIEEAALTGESLPVGKSTTPVPGDDVPLGDRTCVAYMNTAVTRGRGELVVTATGMETEIGHIADLLANTETDKTPLQKQLDELSKIIAAIAGIALVFVVVLGLVRGESFDTLFITGVALAVAAIPTGLPAVVTALLSMGTREIARRHAIVKRLPAVETLGSTSVICSDKTGTLTRSEMTIERVMTASGGTRITGVGYAPEGRVEHEGAELEEGPLLAEDIVVLSGGSLASNAHLRRTAAGVWEIQGDPTEAAFLVAERKLGVAERRRRRFARIREIPFTSERKMMSTIEIDHEHDDSLMVITKGAPDVLLGRSTKVRVGMEVVALDDSWRQRILAEVDALSDAALRTLAVAYRPLEPGEEDAADESLERALIFAGTVGIIDPPRQEAAVAIRDAQRAGIRVIMITGDHPRTATRIAGDLGIVAAGASALTGRELDALDGGALAEAVRRSAVYARVAPQHKLRIVDALRSHGHIVAMTGDGVNDAPALKSADIGVAMGVAGTEVAKQAAKMILADDNFATIVAAVREGRRIFDNIRKFLRYLLSSNMGEVLTVFLGVVLAGLIGLTGPADGLILPLLATQVLWINLITDSGPALAMGVDPETDDVMARPPRRLTERVIDGRMWAGVVAIGVVMAAVALLAIDVYLPGGLIEGSRSLDNARTAGFTVLVFAQLFNCFNARSERTSAFRHVFANSWLIGAVLLSVLLQVAVVNLGFLNVAFGTVPLELGQWFVCAALASSVLWFSELWKWLGRAQRRHACL
jgi:P-type Ca2+ transporter type 2C